MARLGFEPLKFLYSEFLYNTQAVYHYRYTSHIPISDPSHPSRPGTALSRLPGAGLLRGWRHAGGASRASGASGASAQHVAGPELLPGSPVTSWMV